MPPDPLVPTEVTSAGGGGVDFPAPAPAPTMDRIGLRARGWAAAAASLRPLIDRRFTLRAVAWSALAFAAYGLVAAIIPNPVFGRAIPPGPFAIAVWVLSAPLMGLIGATYGYGGPPGSSVAAPLREAAFAPGSAGSTPRRRTEPGADRGSTAAAVGSVAAFVAIGCPVCNKIALLLLGASGAVSVFAPWQPVIGAASLVLLTATLVWRLRMLAAGPVCAVTPTRA